MRAMLMLPLTLLLLTACDGTDDSTGVTAGEAAQLNAAADTLDVNATAPDAQSPDPQTDAGAPQPAQTPSAEE
ncbi:hypothetical protein [Sphingomonas sp.]|uniref:hypothetical protein n=1 Tax=Sphingomonas sp. TaxID=28214 RepID=UPI001ED46A86|nr:hypothetical protein [Sphingomonas sp.]MBX3592891.1 hypothetical protein [Sphingomonas sp.]